MACARTNKETNGFGVNEAAECRRKGGQTGGHMGPGTRIRTDTE